MPRLPLAQRTVTYGSVGGTQAVDLMQYPPRGYRPLELRGRVGHGEARWKYAVEQLLTAGVYRGAGMAVRIIPAAGDQDAAHYVPVGYDEHGNPVEAATLEVPDDEFSPDGERYLRPGDTILVGAALGGRMLYGMPGRIVLRDEAENRVLYAVGTLPGNPLAGEESFLLEREADGGVWLTVRSFARPANPVLALAAPVLHSARRHFARRFLRTLSAPIPGAAPLPSQRAAIAASSAAELSNEPDASSAPSAPAIDSRDPRAGAAEGDDAQRS